jgi:hypothetical protein
MEEFLSNKVDELRKQLPTANTLGEQLVILQQIIALEEQLLRMG